MKSFIALSMLCLVAGCSKPPAVPYQDAETGVTFMVPGGFAQDHQTESFVYFANPKRPKVSFRVDRDWHVELVTRGPSFVDLYKKAYTAPCSVKEDNLEGLGRVYAVQVPMSEESTYQSLILDGPSKKEGQFTYFEVGVSCPPDEAMEWRSSLADVARSFKAPTKSRVLKK